MTAASDAAWWQQVWRTTADAVAAHVEAGRAHLLTEDTLRFAAIRAFEDSGVPPAQLTIEVPLPELGRGKLDLLVEQDGQRAAIEFKFPRDARGPISPDTMTLGELLSDFHRVARLAVDRRWVVQLLGDRYRGYLTRLAARHPVTWPSAVGADLLLTGAAIAGLPETARNALAGWAAGEDVHASCTSAFALPGSLTLFVFDVAALPGVVPVPAPPAEPVPAATGTAREQFLAAAARLTQRTGSDVFRRQDLLDEVVRAGSALSIKTLGQMITTHLCVDPAAEGWGRYADFERIGHGLFRLRDRTGS